MNKLKPTSDGIYKKDDEFYTMNLNPGSDVYGEKLIQENNFEYRHWNPDRSKLGAFLKVVDSLPLTQDIDVLYLGAGDGTTVSHISDIVTHGKIFAVEVAPRPYRNLLNLSEKRKNIYPIMSDAKKPEKYENIVNKVDFLYQDISQRDQVEIFIKNFRFLKEGYYGFLVVKSRSIDVTKPPTEIFDETKEKLLEEEISVEDIIDINRWQKGHAIIITKK